MDSLLPVETTSESMPISGLDILSELRSPSVDSSPEDQAGGAGDVLHVRVAGLRGEAQPQPQQLERHQQHGGGWRGEETLVSADWNYWIVPAWPGTHPHKKGPVMENYTRHLTSFSMVIYQAEHDLWCPINVGWENFAQ